MYFHVAGSPGRENQRRAANGGECPATPLEEEANLRSRNSLTYLKPSAEEANRRSRGRAGECYALPHSYLRPSVEEANRRGRVSYLSKSFKKLQREEGTQTGRGREADHVREVPGGRNGIPATGLSPTDSESKDPDTALSLTGFLPCRINKQCNPV